MFQLRQLFFIANYLQLADVPGIDALYQAMDMEEGVEVVWNEMNIPCVPLDDEGLTKLTEKLSKLTKVEVTDKYNFRLELKHTITYFSTPNSSRLTIKITPQHPNILKLYGSWFSKDPSKMVFITEYYSAGSLHKFIQRRNQVNSKTISVTVWKRWGRQVLSALR